MSVALKKGNEKNNVNFYRLVTIHITRKNLFMIILIVRSPRWRCPLTKKLEDSGYEYEIEPYVG